MSTSCHPYTDLLTNQEDSCPENFSTILLGIRNDLSSKNICESISDIQLPQLELMDEASNSDCQSKHTFNSNSLKLCGGCGEKICDRYLLLALDRYWHNSCLKCHCCGAMLADVGSSCFTRRGLILCKNDYSSMFGCSGVCSGCGETIPPSEMVAKAKPRVNSLDIEKSQTPIISFVFHLKCFTCTKCGSNLKPGDRYAMMGASLVCEQDWQKLIKTLPVANGNLTRKGKVGRPRRTKD
ncbi:LIM domain transcription factor LMO4 [Teleopsis dalmanni]|uniref:LIM domain transcription factor LMO4 n=1 Tax=Teleopsis dalmanni TaxID=139649 RepID=UPI0018CF6DDB|nr:LIM domain transcription factor LMO4 [Teleopsis dalmanni]XP_037959526.1 LIM domain transcription factor LMO4 [Teleopsis dalmanni]XP_037959527.1 LIM domain transcription factor LMO4 [Teleopsis dalmanni]